MSWSIETRGVREVQQALQKASGPTLRKTLQKGTNAAGKFLEPKMRTEAPRRTGRLRRSIKASVAKRQKPAAIVKARPKIAHYRGFVIQGTKPHRIRFPDQRAAGVPKSMGNIQHPGARANNFVERVGERYDDEAVRIAERVIAAELP
jgi:hypothetical protein